jgi:hypothetical protein
MARPVRVLLGAAIIGLSILGAVRYHDADFTIEREVELDPPPAMLDPSGDFGSTTILIRCTSDGGQWVGESGEPVFVSGQDPVPVIDDAMCDSARNERGRRAVAAASVAGLAGGWLIVSGLRKEPVDGLQPASPPA